MSYICLQTTQSRGKTYFTGDEISDLEYHTISPNGRLFFKRKEDKTEFWDTNHHVSNSENPDPIEDSQLDSNSFGFDDPGSSFDDFGGGDSGGGGASSDF